MEYTQTVTALANEANVSALLIRRYAAMGLLDFIRASNGTRLFATGQAPKVREILADRMTRVGRPRKVR